MVIRTYRVLPEQVILWVGPAARIARKVQSHFYRAMQSWRWNELAWANRLHYYRRLWNYYRRILIRLSFEEPYWDWLEDEIAEVLVEQCF